MTWEIARIMTRIRSYAIKSFCWWGLKRWETQKVTRRENAMKEKWKEGKMQNEFAIWPIHALQTSQEIIPPLSFTRSARIHAIYLLFFFKPETIIRRKVVHSVRDQHLWVPLALPPTHFIYPPFVSFMINDLIIYDKFANSIPKVPDSRFLEYANLNNNRRFKDILLSFSRRKDARKAKVENFFTKRVKTTLKDNFMQTWGTCS